jgi:endonuclease/exonuclease/phosphatase family metal-dependent hydrolase
MISLSAHAQTIVPIHTLEAGAPNSSYIGSKITTTGIVVGVTSVGFYLEAKQRDWNNPLTTASEGIFVYTGSTPPAAAKVGNEVSVAGTLQIYPAAPVGALTVGTEIRTNVTVTLLSTGNTLPPAIVLTLTDTPRTGGFTPMLRYQGMRVTANAWVGTAPTGGTIDPATATVTSNGIFYAAVFDSNLNPPAGYTEQGVSVLEPALPAGAPPGITWWDANPEVMIFDSISAGGTALKVVGGAEYTIYANMTGAVDFQSGRATIMLEPGTSAYDFSELNNRATKTANEVGIGTLNVEQLYSSNPTSGSSVITMTSAGYQLRLQKLSLYIRNAMFSPEILALQEVSTPTANIHQTLDDLSAQISTDAIAAGQTDPQYKSCIFTGTDGTGLSNAFLYNPNNVTVINCSLLQLGFGGGPIPGFVAGANFNRQPLVLQANIHRGAGGSYPVTVLNSELLDRTNEDNVSGTGTSVRLRREDQAEYLAYAINSYATAGAHVIAVGDYNAFQFSDGYTDLVGVVKGTPTNSNQIVQGTTLDYIAPNPALIELTPPYSYTEYTVTESGNASMVDHILVTQDIAPSMRMVIAKGNAYYPVADYGQLRMERTSDHDGLVAYFTPGSGTTAASTSTVTASPEPTVYGDGFTLTATVAPTATNTNTPTGTVDFSIDGTVVASAIALSGGTASTTIASGNTYTVGSHALTAVYSGDTNFSGSTATGTHVITLIPTTTTVTLTQAGCVPLGGPAPSYYYNQDFWACANTYNTNGGSVAPTGTFNFTIDGIFNCSILLQVPVPCTGPNPDTGTHQLGGDYLGDAVHGPSSAITVPLTVIPDITTTTVNSGVSNPSYVNQPVAFTATVTGNYAAPTGTVTFVDNLSSTLGVALGTVTLVPNAGGNTSTATFTTSSLAVGTHQITAQVNASLDFDASASVNYQEVILPLAVAVQSTVTLTSSLNPATYGQTVTFTAAIAAAPVGGVTPPVPAPPSGTVAFYDGAILLGTSTVNTTTASATFNTATLAVGGHNITAVYSGDVNYLTQTSNIVLEVINPAYSGPPDFTITIAQNPFSVGVGLTSSVAITVTPLNGWTSDVTLACPANLPYDFTCTLQKTTIAGGSGNTTLTLTTVAPHNCGNNPPYFTGTAQLEMRMGTAALAGLLVIFIPRKRRVMKALLLAMLCILPGVVGCAGNCTDLGTWPGTYHVPITASGVGNATSHTVDLQVQVNL